MQSPDQTIIIELMHNSFMNEVKYIFDHRTTIISSRFVPKKNQSFCNSLQFLALEVMGKKRSYSYNMNFSVKMQCFFCYVFESCDLALRESSMSCLVMDKLYKSLKSYHFFNLVTIERS